MKVKAKWAIKVNGVWRKTGEEFEVDSTAGLLGAVEVLDRGSGRAKAQEKETPIVKAEPEPAAKAEPKEEPEPEAKAEPKPKTAARTRKKTTGK